jgi:hypothetical protein
VINMEKNIARLILIVFHPLIITTLGIILLFRSSFYLASIADEIKQIILLSTFFGTCIVPLLMILSKYFLMKRIGFNDKLFNTSVYLFTALCYYLSYLVISGLPIAGFFKVVFLSGALLLISLSLITLRWNISVHTAGTGALLGATIALLLRLETVHTEGLALIILIGGMSGFACLKLEKNTPAQIYTGYFLGFSVLFLIFNFVR